MSQDDNLNCIEQIHLEDLIPQAIEELACVLDFTFPESAKTDGQRKSALIDRIYSDTPSFPATCFILPGLVGGTPRHVDEIDIIDCSGANRESAIESVRTAVMKLRSGVTIDLFFFILRGGIDIQVSDIKVYSGEKYDLIARTKKHRHLEQMLSFHLEESQMGATAIHFSDIQRIINKVIESMPQLCSKRDAEIMTKAYQESEKAPRTMRSSILRKGA